MPSRDPIHRAAARGYARAAEEYERGRPSYPADAIERLHAVLGLAPDKTVLDLGAGTGKLTRLLSSTGLHLVAVEPVEELGHALKRLTRGGPRVRVVRGTAEAIPIKGGSVDAVVVGQAFHWFRAEAALAEIDRVLRQGGRLGLIWNVRDDSVDWVARLDRLVEQYSRGAPRYLTGAWTRSFAASPFGPLILEQFRNVQRGTVQTVLDRVASISFVGALPDADRDTLLEQIAALLREHPLTAGQVEFDIPYRTDLYWCLKKSATSNEGG